MVLSYLAEMTKEFRKHYLEADDFMTALVIFPLEAGLKPGRKCNRSY